MRKFLVLVPLLLGAVSGSAGTLIYKTDGGEVKWVSGVKIVSIDGSRMIIKINDGTKVISTRSVQKYYDTDIRGGGAFEDDSADYSIRLGDGKITGGKNKGAGKVFSIRFNIFKEAQNKMNAAIRQPFFYLFVLATNSGGQRTLYSYAWPASARASMRTYDEARMLEKAVSLKRPTCHPGDIGKLGSSGKKSTSFADGVATFQLSNLNDSTVIAWYVVAWSKNAISDTKEHHEIGYTLDKNWWIQ